jgi:N6-adenosine-specific RNA methylase IME4
MTFAELSPPYGTIVADPPWHYAPGGPTNGAFTNRTRVVPRYSMMDHHLVQLLPVEELADDNAHLFLWTTNRYLRVSYEIVEAWGFSPSQLLTWCKSPRGLGPGGAFSNTTEFVLMCRRGSPEVKERIDTTWWHWPRGAHSEKPPAFLDIVERVSSGPYVELFARAPRLGWDSWGHGYESERAS